MTAERDPTDFVENEQQAEDRALKAKAKANQEAGDWAELLGTTSGRRIVWGLLEQASVFRTTFDQNPSRAAFQEGQRKLGLVVLNSVMAHAPHQYLTMCNEANVD